MLLEFEEFTVPEGGVAVQKLLVLLLTETLIVCPNSTQLSKFSSIGFVHCAAQFTLTSIASITNSIFKYFLIKFFICVISKYIKSVLHNVYKKETP